ncbi:MAG: TIGR04255 family protein [Polyangiaceae bacterium]|nr:TIGR04255 family protein [Polyangiaceae bacterium]
MTVTTEATKRHYDEPPLEEAIFELFVRPSGSRFAEQGERLAKLLPAYSGKQESLEDFNVFFKLGPGKSVAQGLNHSARRRRLWNPEQTRAVQLGAEMCTHNVRKPYGHFEDHFDAIKQLFATYLEVMEPQQLGWAGQRYINIVKLPSESSPSDFFEIYPRLPTSLPQRHRHPPFAVQVETAEFEQGNVVVNLSLLEVRAAIAVYAIDVYARSSDAVGLDIDALMAWQRLAHSAIGKSFELTITNNARKLFKEKP